MSAVRIDTAIYDLPPARTGKRGRPRIRGAKLSPHDFLVRTCGLEGYLAGCRPVKTKLFGSRQMTAFVTCRADGRGSRRLYLSTMTCHDARLLCGEVIRFCEEDDEAFASIFFYRNRWAIEVIFLELKTFWSLESYMVRNVKAIDLLLNLIAVAYSLSKLLPCIDSDFEAWRGLSTQQVRFRLGKLIQARIFLFMLGRRLQTVENPSVFEEAFSRQLEIFAKVI